MTCHLAFIEAPQQPSRPTTTRCPQRCYSTTVPLRQRHVNGTADVGVWQFPLIGEAALAAACLVALPGAGYGEAAQTLKAMAEAATSRRRTRSGA